VLLYVEAVPRGWIASLFCSADHDCLTWYSHTLTYSHFTACTLSLWYWQLKKLPIYSLPIIRHSHLKKGTLNYSRLCSISEIRSIEIINENVWCAREHEAIEIFFAWVILYVSLFSHAHGFWLTGEKCCLMWGRTEQAVNQTHTHHDCHGLIS